MTANEPTDSDDEKEPYVLDHTFIATVEVPEDVAREARERMEDHAPHDTEASLGDYLRGHIEKIEFVLPDEFEE